VIVNSKRFSDRRAAGRELAELIGEAVSGDAVVLAIPRGGIEIGDEVARALDAPLDIAEVHEVDGPAPEFGLGVVTPHGERNVRRSTAGAVGVDEGELEARLASEREALRAVVDAVRRDRPREPVAGRTVVIVDDTLSNLSETVVIADAARGDGAHGVVLAVAVAADHFGDEIEERLDGIVYVERGGDIVRPEDWFDHLDILDTAEAAAIVVGQQPTR